MPYGLIPRDVKNSTMKKKGICGQRAGEDSQKYHIKAIYQVVLLHKEFNLFCRWLAHNIFFAVIHHKLWVYHCKGNRV